MFALLLSHQNQTLLLPQQLKKRKEVDKKGHEVGFIELLDFTTQELARQFTLLDQEAFNKIKPWEFFNLGWTKKDCEKRSPNILKFISRFNQVSNWISAELLQIADPKKRATTLAFFVDLAKEFETLNNFNGVMEVLSGLSQSSISRLSHTWEASGKTLDDLNKYTLGNFKLLREKLGQSGACIPYLGVYLSDLTFVEEGNEDVLPNSLDLINFDKCRKNAKIIQKLQQFQYEPYALNPVPEVFEFIEKIYLQKPYDEKLLYNLSMKIQPRKGEKTSSDQSFKQKQMKML